MSDKKSVQIEFYAEKRFALSYGALNTMRRNNQFCDVHFVVGGKEISAHKTILASHSSYFNNMISENYITIKNEDITPNSIELLIDFLYTSQLTINDSNVQELLMASIVLILDDVKAECLKYIEYTIDMENFMTVKSIADTNKIEELHELFVSFILKNYENVIKSKAFLSFSFELIMKLIQSDDLCGEEEKVYESTMLWLKHDLNERLKYLPELLKYIRLSLMSIDYLDNIVQEEDLIKSDIKLPANISKEASTNIKNVVEKRECKESTTILFNKLTRNELNEGMSNLCHAYKVHRQIKPMDTESSLNNNITRRKLNQISQSLNIPEKENFKDYINKNFLSIKDLPEFMSLPFEQFMEVIKSDDLYAEEIEVYKATISWVKYDEKNRSELLPKLFLSVRLPLIPLKDLISIVENEKLVSSNFKCMDMLHNTYKILAMNKKELMNTIKSSESTIYNFRNHHSKQVLILYEQNGKPKIEWFDSINKTFYEITLTWSYGIMPHASNLILRDGRIFCIKYNTESREPGYIPMKRTYIYYPTNSVILYNGDLKTWKSISKSHFVHSHPSIVQFYDHIYVMSSTGVEYYDILKETWHEVKFKISILEDVKLTVVSDLIYGICNSKAFFYNPKTDSAQIICSVNTDITIYSTCSFNDQLYVIGGKMNNSHYIVVEKYNSHTNTWITVSTIDSNIRNPGVVEINGLIYLMGGDNSNSISYCNPRSGEWKQMLGVSLNSSKHTNTQAFIIDAKENIDPKNILEYYSSNTIQGLTCK